MQILKETIKSSITEAACDEFYQHGFENASLRSIASRAGVTVGNIYRYFDNKHDLFCHIIAPAYEKIRSLHREHDSAEYELKLSNAEMSRLIEQETGLWAGEILSLKRELVIMMYGSKGTAFEDSREDIIGHYTSHIMDHFTFMCGNAKAAQYVNLAEAISVSFVSGYISLINRDDIPQDTIFVMLKELTRIFIYGFMQYCDTLKQGAL